MSEADVQDNVLDAATDTHDLTEAPDIEKRAREMGWVPEDEWRGDPPKSGFVSAEEFVRRGEEVVPIIRAHNKRLQAESAELKDRLAKMERDHRETIKRLERMSEVALKLQRDQIEAQYAARKEAAVEIGDKDAYRQAVKEEKEAIKTMDELLAEPEKDGKDDDKPDMPPSVKQAIDEWRAENPWFDLNVEMQSWAVGYHGRLLKEKPGLSLRENLDLVSERARKLFPDAFGSAADDDTEPPRRRGSPVEGGSRMPGGGGRSLAGKLPADAKAQATRFIKEDGLFLEKGETVEKDFNKALERYAAQYFGDEK